MRCGPGSANARSRSAVNPPALSGRVAGTPKPRASATTALATAMFFYFYDRNWERLFAIADEVYHSSEAEGFAMWMANAGLHRGRARIGLGDVARGVAEVMEWSALFRQTGSGVIEGSATSMACEAMHLAGRSEEALVVSREGELRAKTGHVGGMWVDPGVRGRGAGRALVDAAIVWARSRGLDRLELWVTKGNGPAVRLYERAGFADTGRRDVLPSNPALQTIQMALNL